MTEIRNIGVLTGGGDCPGLNAVIRAVVRTAAANGIKIWGIRNGFGGLVENQIFLLDSAAVSGILPRGGTILGTTNRDNPFHYRVIENGETVYRDVSAKAAENLQKAGIEALVVIGGDGTLKIGARFSEYGIKVIAVPKTIDNDLSGTERTFGFDTAVGVATEALDRLHTTAESHHRVMLLEVMGRYAGWIALHSGLSGGADCILIPEIPYRLEGVTGKIKQRLKEGKHFSIIVVSEGAKPEGGEMSGTAVSAGSTESIRLMGAGERLAREIETQTGAETRCTVLGHLQRGGSPTAFDRLLATRYGFAAVQALLDGKTDCMVALKNDFIVTLPIAEVVGKPNYVTDDCELMTTARAIGIAFGD